VFLQDLYLSFLHKWPQIIKSNSKAVLFADDTSLITINPSPIDFKKDITTACVQLNEWFNANLLFLNYVKTHCIHFMTKSSSFLDIVIGYNNNLIMSTSNSEFLGIVIENLLSRKAHVDQLTPNLWMACYAIRAIKLFMSLDTPEVGILFLLSLSCELWNNILGRSSQGVPVLTQQKKKKRVMRIITRSRPRDPLENY